MSAKVKWANRKRQKPYQELWHMLYGFDEYESGLIYRYKKAQERIQSLDTTIDVLNKRIVKLEKDLVKIAESGGDKDD